MVTTIDAPRVCDLPIALKDSAKQRTELKPLSQWMKVGGKLVRNWRIER